MTDTAHERYEKQVHTGEWHAYDDLLVFNQREQIAGLVAERDALNAVIDAKQAQVDALLNLCDEQARVIVRKNAELAELRDVRKLGIIDGKQRIPQP
jgi:hypothetical protein